MCTAYVQKKKKSVSMYCFVISNIYTHRFLSLLVAACDRLCAIQVLRKSRRRSNYVTATLNTHRLSNRTPKNLVYICTVEGNCPYSKSTLRNHNVKTS